MKLYVWHQKSKRKHAENIDFLNGYCTERTHRRKISVSHCQHIKKIQFFGSAMITTTETRWKGIKIVGHKIWYFSKIPFFHCNASLNHIYVPQNKFCVQKPFSSLFCKHSTKNCRIVERTTQFSTEKQEQNWGRIQFSWNFAVRVKRKNWWSIRLQSPSMLSQRVNFIKKVYFTLWCFWKHRKVTAKLSANFAKKLRRASSYMFTKTLDN